MSGGGNGRTARLKTAPRTLSYISVPECYLFSFQLNADLVARVDSLSIDGCRSIKVNVRDSSANATFPRSVDLSVENADNVELVGLGSSLSFVGNLFLDNVSYVESAQERSMTSTAPTEAFEMPSNEELYFYGLIAAVALLVATWIGILITCFFSTKRHKLTCCGFGSEKRGKRVSRTQSWRYESRMYVNPNGGRGRLQQQQQQQQQRLLNNVGNSGSGGGGGSIYRPNDYSPAAGLEQMLPYQLLPQREASLLRTHGYYEEHGQEEKPRTAMTSSPLTDRLHMTQTTHLGDDGAYTDSSLQYVDDEDLGSEEGTRSVANSASYSSRNRNRTLPLQQQQLQ